MIRENFLKRIWYKHLDDFNINIAMKETLIKAPNLFGIFIEKGLYVVYKTDKDSNPTIINSYDSEDKAFHKLYKTMINERYLLKNLKKNKFC